MLIPFLITVAVLGVAFRYYRSQFYKTTKPKKDKIRNPQFDIPTIDISSSPDDSNSLNHLKTDYGLAQEFLFQQQWPEGLQMYLFKSVQHMPQRFFICDDSGSMSGNDGHQLVATRDGTKKLVNCSRWNELTEALKFHAKLAKDLDVPTEFRLLNGSKPIEIGGKNGDNRKSYDDFIALLSKSPGGGTPLCRHIREITAKIKAMAHKLRETGQRAVLMIATDGESSDGDIAEAMAPLKDLPVWVVLKLCTDDEKVVKYWNKIDELLELDMDVLDDFVGEGKEVGKVNDWLTYGEPLHRLREFGVHLKELDRIDEARLSGDEVRQICSIVFNVKKDSLAHPEAELGTFVKQISQLNDKSPLTWNPSTGMMSKWIDINKLRKINQPAGGGCAIC